MVRYRGKAQIHLIMRGLFKNMERDDYISSPLMDAWIEYRRDIWLYRSLVHAETKWDMKNTTYINGRKRCLEEMQGYIKKMDVFVII